MGNPTFFSYTIWPILLKNIKSKPAKVSSPSAFARGRGNESSIRLMCLKAHYIQALAWKLKDAENQALPVRG